MGNTNNNTFDRYNSKQREMYESYHKCHKCDKKFVHGEIIFHKRGRKYRKSYHKACWEALLQK